MIGETVSSQKKYYYQLLLFLLPPNQEYTVKITATSIARLKKKILLGNKDTTILLIALPIITNMDTVVVTMQENPCNAGRRPKQL
jgi:hypothetical protein